MSISRQERLFGEYNKETGKAEILPCKIVGKEEFEAEAKSSEMKEVAEKILQVVNQECFAREAGNTEEAKRLHGMMQKIKKVEDPVYCFQGYPANEHRVAEQMILNGLYMADFDDVGDVEQKFREWADLWPELDPKKARLQKMADELGLVYIGKSISTKGIRIVGKCSMEIGTPFDNALWLGKQLMLEVTQDSKCKDLSRCSYAVPWDYIEWLSDELFTYNNKEYDEKFNKRKNEEEKTTSETDNKSEEVKMESVKAESVPSSPTSISYLGISISKYIDTYWQLFNHGETPKEGARDTLTFELCCDLRHILGFNREQMLQAIPSYDGFPESERQKVIDSALSRERGPMPYRMRKVLETIQKQYEHNPEIASAFEEADVNFQTDVLYRVLPFGIKDSVSNLPRNMIMPVLTSLFPNIGAQATLIRLDIHHEGFRGLNIQAYVVGKAASNKGIMTDIYHIWTRPMKEHDDQEREKEMKQEAIIRKAKNKTEQPEEKHFPQYLQSLRTSMSEVLYRLQHAQGRHLLSYTSESDQLAAGQGQMWSNMSVLLRCAYDGDQFSQDYKSETSTRAWIDHVLWNIILCGTPDALYRMYKNYTDGSITRLIIARTPDNTYAPLTIRKSRSSQANANIEALTRLLPLMQGELELPKLELRSQQWLERVRLESMKADDPTRAGLRFRIAVSVMRCVCTMMLCDFGGWLIKEIDRKETKPEWAEGCTTSEEYLSKHPEATALWVPKKFQKRQLLEVYDILADYYLNNALYFFRHKIEDATEKQMISLGSARVIRGKNDDIYTQLPQHFTLQQAQQARQDHDYDRTRSMVKNWSKAGLVKNVGTGAYEKLAV